MLHCFLFLGNFHAFKLHIDDVKYSALFLSNNFDNGYYNCITS